MKRKLLTFVLTGLLAFSTTGLVFAETAPLETPITPEPPIVSEDPQAEVITIGEAITIALEAVPDGSIVSIKLDKQHTVKVYKIQVKSGALMNMVKINAMTGDVLKTELENDPVAEPVTDPTIDPITDPVTDPITDPTTDPITDPTTDPITDPTTDPITDPTTDPITDPTTDPITDPTTDPITDPTTDPITDPTTDPITDPTTDPITDPTTNPVIDPITDPVTDPTTDPITDPVTDPTAEPTTEDPVATLPAISFENAVQIALASVTDGTFVSIRLGTEHDVMVYKVIIQTGKKANQIKIDATSGDILKPANDKNDKKPVIEKPAKKTVDDSTSQTNLPKVKGKK
nr:PepSY domain-containing protein [uncultured Acetobacterium sp.]